MKDTTQLITEAGVKIFAEHGFAGARVDRIAELSGVNKAMIYYHFKSKEGLYRAILTRFDEELIKTVKDISKKNDDPLEKIYAVCDGMVEYISNTDDDIKKILIWEIASGGKIIRDIKLHKLIFPMLKMVYEMYISAKKKKQINDINPVAAHLMIVATTVFTNMIRFVINDKSISGKILGKDFPKSFMNDVMKIFKYGIVRR